MGKPKLDPKDLEENQNLFTVWSKKRTCPKCNNDKIGIRKVGNFGANAHQCYANGASYWKFHCSVCRASWHGTNLQLFY